MEVHSGILTIKAPSLLKTKLYSNYWCILYTGRSKFSPRIDLYEEKPQVGHTPCKKTIYIEEAKWMKINSLDSAFSFEVKHNKQYIFVTASESEVILWILNLCCVSKELFDTKYIIGIEDLDKMDSYQTEIGEEYVVKENILYSSYSELHTFVVTASQTGACIQHSLQGLYKLRVGHTGLQLLHHDSEKEVASWSLMTLKKFGHTPYTFFLESGTRSTTGAGRFIFQTVQGEKITECLNSEALRLHNQNHESDNSSATEVFKGSARSDADHTERAKRPVPPQKPNSMSLRNSLPENTELQGMHYVNGKQLSRKGIPAFGIPVFCPPTGQVPNEMGNNDDLAPVEGEGTIREDLNDLAFQSASVENNTKPLLKWSSSCQSESGSKKDGKKSQKEWKKEQKKREEEEKKERKRQEEEQKKREEEEKKERKRQEEEQKKREEEDKKERKRQEEEKKKEQKKREEDEKRIKKEQKKKQKETKGPSSSSRSASVSDSVVSCASPDAEDFSTYAEVDLEGPSVTTEKIYSEPWGALLCIPVSPGGDGGEVVYAQPEKRPVHQTAAFEPREITHIENYETVETTEPEYSAPHVILPKQEQTGEIGDTDIYSHLNAGKSTVMPEENLYGMASASSTVTAFDDENAYEDTSASIYESVG